MPKTSRDTTSRRPFLQASVLAVLWAAALFAPSASAAPILAGISGCVGSTCTVEPNGGPAPLDPAGFTMDVDFGPDCLELLPEAEGEWRVVLRYEFTGIHGGTESFGTLTLLDKNHAPIAPLNEQFDDTNVVGNVIPAVYEVFGPPDTAFKVYGFGLTLSDGSGVDTLKWVSATFSPAAVGQDCCRVPEPSLVLLLGLAGGCMGLRRRWRR